MIAMAHAAPDHLSTVRPASDGDRDRRDPCDPLVRAGATIFNVVSGKNNRFPRIDFAPGVAPISHIVRRHSERAFVLELGDG